MPLLFQFVDLAKSLRLSEPRCDLQLVCWSLKCSGVRARLVGMAATVGRGWGPGWRATSSCPLV